MSRATTLVLMRQRHDLVAQIGIERAMIAQDSASLQRLSQIIDRVCDVIQHLRKHPEILLLPLAITVVSRPRRLLALAISGFGLWRLFQSWRHQILS